jgi:hypothetical protein
VPVDDLPPVAETDLEALKQPEFQRLSEARLVVVRRLENVLVHEFRDWLQASHQISATALDIPYAPEARSLRADLWLASSRVLIEAKASGSREAIRMAIGQLLDYARYLAPRPRLCVLTPIRPADDMLTLLAATGMTAAWRQDQSGFSLSDPAVLLASS